MQRIKIVNSATVRESDSLAAYLRDIRKTPLLTTEEEHALVKKYRQGDLNALDKIVKANLRFVVSVAKFYQHQGLTLSDLISEGNIGLMKAVEQFDETRGFKFISYAVWWIRQSIIRALTEHSRTIRLPRNKVAALSKVRVMYLQLEQEYEREPTFEEISSIMKLEVEDIKKALGFEVKQVSIDAPLQKDEIASLLDIIEDINAEHPDHKISHTESLKKEINFLLTGLSQNQAEVVEMYYGFNGQEPMNLAEIGKKLNVSSERIRQIKEAALHKLKTSKRSKNLKTYFGR